jgi:hypothetical protein
LATSIDYEMEVLHHRVFPDRDSADDASSLLWNRWSRKRRFQAPDDRDEERRVGSFASSPTCHSQCHAQMSNMMWFSALGLGIYGV